MTGPLAGIRIVDLTEGVAGPFASKNLADYGADVIKVERPGGDPARLLPPFPGDAPHPEKSGLFAYLNTNKRSVVLDPAIPAGRDAILRLAAGADAVMECFAPGSMARWGLGYDALAAANPRLVMTSLTPFGQDGPAAGRKETDLTLNARSSWLLQAGSPEREPLQYYGRQPSYLAGLHTAWGTAVALLHAGTTGEGQWVDVSMFEAAMMTFDQGLLAASYFPTKIFQRPGRRMLRFPPQMLPVADGYVSLLITDLQWPRFCRMAEAPELANDPDLTTQDKRIARFEELEVVFIPWFLSRTKQEVFDEAQKHGVPIAPFNDIAALLEDPHFDARGFFETVVHPVLGSVKMSGRPSILSETPWEIRRPAPLLDQHRDEILTGDLGYTAEDLSALRPAGETR